MQCGPSASWPVVLVPMAGPRREGPVSMMRLPRGHGDGAAVEAAGRRAALLLADPVVLRAVAGALEPLRGLAERHPAAEVDALLVERHEAGVHAGQHRRRNTPSRPSGGLPSGTGPARYGPRPGTAAFFDPWIWAVRSSTLPALIFEPNPPPTFGHRKAIPRRRTPRGRRP